ncbi:MAG: acetamidase/formamidase family protein [Syntrophorhabdaceae bacterium]|nr:acetamidase/formamidase family protein [Syntrophorhabdaceae bacterium]
MPNYHILKATPETVKWGYFDNSQKPALTIKPGDIVEIETITHHAGDAPDLLMDDGVRAIYDAIPESERIPGVHIMTGPICVEGAEPGDVLEVKVLDMRPRLDYGINFGANWGLLYEDFKQKEHVVIFKIDMKSGLVKAVSSYPYWTLCDKPGRITEPGKVPRTPCLKNIYVPAGLHFGTAGVAPKEAGKIDTVPPGPFGGNIDNRSFVSGTSMLYPVQVKGALFTAGDAHFAQGDGEISGTAIEGHVNATLQFSLNKNVKLIENPVLNSSTKWTVHGFDEDLNQAIRRCALEAIAFLCANYGLSREEAYALLSIAGDFHVTQVVDRKKGVHCSIRKALFVPAE